MLLLKTLVCISSRSFTETKLPLTLKREACSGSVAIKIPKSRTVEPKFISGVSLSAKRYFVSTVKDGPVHMQQKTRHSFIMRVYVHAQNPTIRKAISYGGIVTMGG
ncbi:hypothetical protein B9Q02_10440 [Candidatus Marsarchaeota G1 archaeon BE_D]|uniref:Uncharacterized protein n=1 Tax=Candidatus Marsarchaeota G1 archaeon BE_D TaxID=1978156 RepID=A0A2R6AAW3_9ARCH|nr:MAG: hypothetical protein B9Q02_10440 [Candidatus Marsarchaeota G1 archaeon BE_D]